MMMLRNRLGVGSGQKLGAVVMAVVLAAFMAATANAAPEDDASIAITQAWEAAGGVDSSVGAPDGGVYPVGRGYGQNFTGGKIFYTPDTGAHLIGGAVLEKYEALGGPADSDVGFPTMDEVPGLIGPDSRVSTFSASDTPAIFSTPETGAWVVRGALNAAWDRLGGSGGPLGVPVADETYADDVVSQKFTGGELSWNRVTGVFTTIPEEFAADVNGIDVPTDPTTMINMAWRASGGLSGPLGVHQGDQSVLDNQIVAQRYAGGTIFFSPGTGAHAVTGAIAEKYESLGGAGSDVGLPITDEADGGVPNSRFNAFSAPDQPVIFWTPDTGAVVVRGEIATAWTTLGGAAGILGVPTGAATVSEGAADDDTVVTQTFSGGQLSWNQDAGVFTAQPASVVSELVGADLPVADSVGAGDSAQDDSSGGLSWPWWLWVLLAVLVVFTVVVISAVWLRYRRSEHHGELDTDMADDGLEGYTDFEDRISGVESTAIGSAGARAWHSGTPDDLLGHQFSDSSYVTDRYADQDHDPDAVDTAPTRVIDPARIAEYDQSRDEFHGESFFSDSRSDSGVGDIAGDSDYVGGMGHDEADSGRHAAANVDSSAMWTLGVDVAGAGVDVAGAGVDEVGRRRHHRMAAEQISDEQELDEQGRDSGDSAQLVDRPAIHLPLADPYEAPEGYSIKATTHSGLYYTPDCELYHHTIAEVWFATEELARANGFIKAE